MWRTRFFLWATWSLWLLAVLGLAAWLLWIGGGITEAASWEFFSWSAGSLTAIVAVLGTFTVFVLRGTRTPEEEGAPPWPHKRVEWTRAAVCFSLTVVLIGGVLLGGAGQHVAHLLKESVAERTGAAGNGAGNPGTSETATPEIDDPSEGTGEGVAVTSSPDDPQEDVSAPVSPSPERKSLLGLSRTSSTHHQDTGTVRVGGDTYTEAVHLGSCALCSMEYDLGKDWTTFEATIGLADDSEEGAEVTFRMYADSDPVLSHTLSRGEVEEISIDVAGALYLKLEAERVSSGGIAVWGDPAVFR
ncbi:NPCBM/NEW2 domain-containing protein [Nocardiopsis lambiniae]|uniref:NPCBM/NEW2 domain-containing protein n=1 Tax=Nocardiopsis lambiniae TaxID=3075539 RepID=A0ABU2MFL9_9ACTN|nr:NPCBM/NEW2 domain-containing protein [Nocardiopsis sp. DSM 44743]MDT0331493.1 NPCBM/NEW2 domain-containing protein [Nocardiopsis sp. DSM 44743]